MKQRFPLKLANTSYSGKPTRALFQARGEALSRFPEVWRQGRCNLWPYAEGGWVKDNTKPFLLTGAIYLVLLDIAEAKADIERRNQQLADELTLDLAAYFNPVIAAAKAGRDYPGVLSISEMGHFWDRTLLARSGGTERLSEVLVVVSAAADCQ